MSSFQDYMDEYRKQLEKGVIQSAYRGLIDYLMDLRSYFKNKYPDYLVSGSLYLGYMDMTYFSFFPKPLKRRGLKVGIVFIHDKFRFEVWLFGYNKGIQAKYLKYFKESGWDKYKLMSTTKGIDFIVEDVLVEDPNFSDLDGLTKQIENGTLKFIEDVENFLSKHLEWE